MTHLAIVNKIVLEAHLPEMYPFEAHLHVAQPKMLIAHWTGIKKEFVAPTIAQRFPVIQALPTKQIGRAHV